MVNTLSSKENVRVSFNNDRILCVYLEADAARNDINFILNIAHANFDIFI